MSDLNSIQFTGRLTADPELREVGAKNTPVLKFCVANNTGWGNQENTTFFNCQIWGQRAISLKQYMGKGRQIALKGRIEANKWVDANGVTHNDMQVTADEIVLLAVPQNNGLPQQFNGSSMGAAPQDMGNGSPMQMEEIVF